MSEILNFQSDCITNCKQNKDAESEIKLIKICSKCHSDRVAKNGKTASGYQRWKCRDCDRSSSDRKTGRPTIGDRPMTVAERKQRSRGFSR